MTSSASASYTIEDLCEAAGVSARTIRSWIARGLVPSTTPRGPLTRYDAAHRERVVAIARLRAAEVPLRDIPRRLAAEAAAAQAAAARPPVPELVRLPLAPSYPARPWQRVELVPGLELHVDLARGPVLGRLAQAVYDWFGPGGGAGIPPGADPATIAAPAASGPPPAAAAVDGPPAG